MLSTSTNVANFVPGTKHLFTFMISAAIFGKNPYRNAIRLSQSIKNNRKPAVSHTLDLEKRTTKEC